MIKTTLGHLVNCSSQNGIAGPIERLGNMNLPVKTSFRFAELMDLVDKKLQHFVKHRLDLYKKHGDHDEEKDTYELKTEEQQTAFKVEYDELVNMEIELPGERFKMRDFYQSTAVAPNDIRALRWLIDFGVAVPVPAAIEDEAETPGEQIPEPEAVEPDKAQAARSVY